VVSPDLWLRGIPRIDAIALTHAHAHHMGGMPAVIANFHPHELWLPEGIPDHEIQNLLSEARASAVKSSTRKLVTVLFMAEPPSEYLRQVRAWRHGLPKAMAPGAMMNHW